MIRYLFKIGVVLSMLINVILGGHVGQTMSHRANSARRDGRRWGCVLCRILDAIDPHHCSLSRTWRPHDD